MEGIQGQGRSHFCAIVSRMRYIERWQLMRNTRGESLAEHTLDVAMIAHLLCLIANIRYGRSLDADRAAVIALYHDASEIITGDMPTPVKYRNDELRGAYKDVEREAEEDLMATLPDDLRPAFADVFIEGAEPADGDEAYLWALVKAADKISAYLKCVEEEGAGNVEFRAAATATFEALLQMRADYPEVGDFMDEFLPSYGLTLDELLR